MNGKNEQPNADIDLDKYEAAILDMDGVVTETARAHAAFWKPKEKAPTVTKYPNRLMS